MTTPGRRGEARKLTTTALPRLRAPNTTPNPRRKHNDRRECERKPERGLAQPAYGAIAAAVPAAARLLFCELRPGGWIVALSIRESGAVLLLESRLDEFESGVLRAEDLEAGLFFGLHRIDFQSPSTVGIVSACAALVRYSTVCTVNADQDHAAALVGRIRIAA